MSKQTHLQYLKKYMADALQMSPSILDSYLNTEDEYFINRPEELAKAISISMRGLTLFMSYMAPLESAIKSYEDAISEKASEYQTIFDKYLMEIKLGKIPLHYKERVQKHKKLVEEYKKKEEELPKELDVTIRSTPNKDIIENLKVWSKVDYFNEMEFTEIDISKYTFKSIEELTQTQLITESKRLAAIDISKSGIFPLSYNEMVSLKSALSKLVDTMNAKIRALSSILDISKSVFIGMTKEERAKYIESNWNTN